jgi:hypothetical protein
MRTITAVYKLTDVFHVPASIPLLSKEENDKVRYVSKPWSWFIKFQTLVYYDADLKEHEIEPYDKADGQPDYKHWDEIEEGCEEDDECDECAANE